MVALIDANVILNYGKKKAFQRGAFFRWKINGIWKLKFTEMWG